MNIPIDRLELIKMIEASLRAPEHHPTPQAYKRIIEKQLREFLAKLKKAKTLEQIGAAFGERFPRSGINIDLPEYLHRDTETLRFLLDKLRASKAKVIRVSNEDRKLFRMELTDRLPKA